MSDLPAVSPLAPEVRRRLLRLRAAVGLLALLFLFPFFVLAVEIREETAYEPLLLGALGLGGPALLALMRLRRGPAPSGLRLARAVAVVALLGAVLGLWLASVSERNSGLIAALASAGGILAWVTGREAAALRDEAGGPGDGRASWTWTQLRVLAYYALNLMVLGCGGIISLKDPRRTAEPRAIGDIRILIAAQAAYQAANAGLYEGNLRCLAEPHQGCIPGYPANAPTFLDRTFVDRSLASLSPVGFYEREFVPGPPPKRLDPKRSSPTSVTAYSYRARPVRYGGLTRRSFFADETGAIHFTGENRPATARDPLID